MQRKGARIGVLDLDVFGPSVPKLMGLEDVTEPELTPGMVHASFPKPHLTYNNTPQEEL
jgi:Mrp family chromosome partitioning ATPase